VREVDNRRVSIIILYAIAKFHTRLENLKVASKESYEMNNSFKKFIFQEIFQECKNFKNKTNF